MSDENTVNSSAEEVKTASSVEDVKPSNEKQEKKLVDQEVMHKAITERLKREGKQYAESLKLVEDKLNKLLQGDRPNDENPADMKLKALEAKIAETEERTRTLEKEKLEETAKRVEAEKSILIAELLNKNRVTGDHQNLAKELLSKKFRLEDGILYWVDGDKAVIAEDGLKQFLTTNTCKRLTPASIIPTNAAKTKPLSQQSEKLLNSFKNLL
jgi:hypothetical protein